MLILSCGLVIILLSCNFFVSTRELFVILLKKNFVEDVKDNTAKMAKSYKVNITKRLQIVIQNHFPLDFICPEFCVQKFWTNML